MHSLSAHDLLRVWEEGERQHPLDRALTILAAATPGATRDALARLPIGVRDRQLLALRGASFGATLECYQECPACGERLEFALAVSDLMLPHTGESREVVIDEQRYLVRSPNSHDMAAAMGAGEPHAARAVLLERCVEGDSGDAGEEVMGRLIEAIQMCDPQADPRIDMRCPACGHAWSAVFDIASYLWSEICVAARRVAHDVHTLARAYGWSERDILSMTPERRQLYLEMVL